MENSEVKDYMRSNLKIVEFAIGQWKILLSVALLAGIFAAVFSSARFIPPKFKSEAVLYPANIGEYGGETELEQLQQYLESNEIRDHIIEKFNLWDEYDISREDSYKNTWVNLAYSEHISFDETRFESVRITVFSTDPVKARDIVNEIIDQLNQIKRKTEQEKYGEVVEINKKFMLSKKALVDSLERQMSELSTKYGLLDYEAQSERVTEKYMEFLLSGKKGAGYEEAKTLYENLQKHGKKMDILDGQLTDANNEYLRRLNGYEASLKDYNKVQTFSNVLVKSEVADKKSYPIRWLIVLVAIAASVGFTFVLLLILGFQKRS